MKWLLVVLLVGCQPVEAAPVVTPTPVVVYVTPTPGPTPFVYPVLDPRNVVVGIGAQAGSKEREAAMTGELPDAWRVATGGRSELVLLPWTEFAPVYLILLDERTTINGVRVRGNTQVLAGGRVVIANIYQFDDAPLLRVVLHELGHALGCCSGAEADAGLHWRECGDELMCHKSGTSLIFSERELRQMGL